MLILYQNFGPFMEGQKYRDLGYTILEFQWPVLHLGGLSSIDASLKQCHNFGFYAIGGLIWNDSGKWGSGFWSVL